MTNLLFALGLMITLGLKSQSSSAEEIVVAFVDQDDRPSIHNLPYRRSLISAALDMVMSDNKDSLKKSGISIKIQQFLIGKIEAEAITATGSAILSKAIAGVGLVTSKYAILGAPTLKETDFVLVSPYASASALTKYRPNFQMLASPGKFISRGIREFWKTKLKSKSVAAVVAWDCAYCRDVYENLPFDLKSKTSLFKVLENNEEISKVVSLAMKKKHTPSGKIARKIPFVSLYICVITVVFCLCFRCSNKR